MARQLICEIAWAAGFFDGEGCTRSYRQTASDRPGWSVRAISLQISQKDRELLDRFARAVKLSKGRVYYRSSGNGSWVLSVGTYAEVNRVVEMMWPYLGRIKRAQAKDALRSYRNARQRLSRYSPLEV